MIDLDRPFDDYIDPQRGDVDVPAEARRVRRYECACNGCRRQSGPWPTSWYRDLDHDDRTFPVYGPPTPHEPRRMAPA